MDHKEIQESLSKLSDINEQMSLLRSLCSLQGEDLKQQEEVRYCIEKLLKKMYPRCKVHLFGSRINGLGFRDSDIDAYIGKLIFWLRVTT